MRDDGHVGDGEIELAHVHVARVRIAGDVDVELGVEGRAAGEARLAQLRRSAQLGAPARLHLQIGLGHARGKAGDDARQKRRERLEVGARHLELRRLDGRRELLEAAGGAELRAQLEVGLRRHQRRAQVDRRMAPDAHVGERQLERGHVDGAIVRGAVDEVDVPVGDARLLDARVLDHAPRALGHRLLRLRRRRRRAAPVLGDAIDVERAVGEAHHVHRRPHDADLGDLRAPSERHQRAHERRPHADALDGDERRLIAGRARSAHGHVLGGEPGEERRGQAPHLDLATEARFELRQELPLVMVDVGVERQRRGDERERQHSDDGDDDDEAAPNTSAHEAQARPPPRP